MRFQINFDYLCPFARNANEAVIAGLEAGRDWDVTFRPFSLSQVHTNEGDPPVFDDVSASGVRALLWGVAIRDSEPEHFPAAHMALFSARHDQGRDVTDESVIRDALADTGVDIEAIAAVVESGTPAKSLATEHNESVERWQVFGVPTFIKDDVATFIRFMDRGNLADLDRALDMLDWSGLNEFKRTTRSR
ncbi:MAG: DsbA family protein [Acidimicrobiia bacterium]